MYWEAANLVDAYNAVKDPNETLADSGAEFADYYLLSRAPANPQCASYLALPIG